MLALAFSWHTMRSVCAALFMYDFNFPAEVWSGLKPFYHMLEGMSINVDIVSLTFVFPVVD
jgi:hypothetical protein